MQFNPNDFSEIKAVGTDESMVKILSKMNVNAVYFYAMKYADGLFYLIGSLFLLFTKYFVIAFDNQNLYAILISAMGKVKNIECISFTEISSFKRKKRFLGGFKIKIVMKNGKKMKLDANKKWPYINGQLNSIEKLTAKFN